MKKMNWSAATVLALTAVFATSAYSAEAALTDDGLAPVKVRNIDKAYKRPGASLSSYKQIILKPVTVEFSRGWNPRDYGTFGLKSADVEKLRSSLATIADETFRKTLTAGGYPVVAAPGETVLEVEAHLVDVIVNAPDVPTAGRTRTYVFSAGEMRVVATLRDSIAGTVLYRAIDRRRGPETGRLEWASSVWNRVEAERALAGWATQLKNALDAARASTDP
jgi:hypothetical protein